MGRLEKASYAEEDRRFLDAVLGERPPSPDADDGNRAVELVEARYRAVTAGVPVPLPPDAQYARLAPLERGAAEPPHEEAAS